MSFGCSKAWARRVQSEILSRYPNVLVVQARAYERPREVDTDLGRVTIPGVIKPTEAGSLPLTEVRRFLSQAYEPDAPPQSMVIQYHPLGGFAFIRQ